LGVAERAKDFADAFGAGQLGCIAGLCHDLGKYSSEFQRRLEGSGVRVDHSSAGAALLFGKYGPVGRLLAYAVAGHHGGIPDGGDSGESSLLWRVKRKDIPDFSAYIEEIKLPDSAPRLPICPQTCWPGFSVSFFVRLLFSCLVDADFLDTEAFTAPTKSRWRSVDVDFGDLERRLTGHLGGLTASARPTVVNRKRGEVLEDCLAAAEHEPGLFTLTVPTGGGKTLSSLAFALRHAQLHGLRRVIYVIPFTSIIEQNARVFRSAIGPDLVLEHHSNFICPEASDDDPPSPIELAEENWDVPLVVTTNVQFFESLFSNRPSRCRKLHNIARSVVILDEAQMLPVETLRPCVAAICELSRNYGTTVVMCSATQPALGGLFPEGIRPREIARNPSDLYTALRRVHVRNLGVATDQEIVTRLRQHDQALCIVNTRKHARQVFELLGKGPSHFHLTAAICPIHRAERLDEIQSRLKRGEACRVISTQLIEAGVDVDFPVVIRAIAGIDSIAQACGRCNREGRSKRGEVFVFTPAEGEGLSHLWFARTAAIARTILEREEDPLNLEVVRCFFEELYFYEGSRSNCGNRPSGLDSKGIMERMEVAARHLEFPFREVSELFKIIGEETVGVVIPFDDKCQRLLGKVRALGISRDLRRRLQPYAVSLRPWEFQGLLDAGLLEDVDGVPVLADMRAYDADYGLLPSTERGGESFIV